MLDWLQLNMFELALNLTDANKRIFYGYLITSTCFASIVYFATQVQMQKSSLLGYLFNPKVWLHKSSLADYQLMLLNKLIKALLITPLLFAALPIAVNVNLWLTELFNLSTKPAVGSQTAIWFFTLILFLLDDFSRFLLHYLLHKVPFLWRIHQVHHSAEVLTPLTIYRSHPIENLLYAMRMTLVQGLAVGITMSMYGPFITMFDILGANVFIFIFNLFGANLRHSHIWWSWGKIEYVFISPAQHQLHHGKQAKYYDCNFGTVLSIWDKIKDKTIHSEAPALIHDDGNLLKINSLVFITLSPWWFFLYLYGIFLFQYGHQH